MRRDDDWPLFCSIEIGKVRGWPLRATAGRRPIAEEAAPGQCEGVDPAALSAPARYGISVHELVINEDHYEKVLTRLVEGSQRFLWIATADIKDVHVEGPGRTFIPFLSVLADLVKGGVEVRLIHAKEPGPAFREDFDRFPALVASDNFERILCPRMHMKVFIADGRLAYVGSANLTGAGIGAKSPKRRNFEAGFLTDDAATIETLMHELDELYLGKHCVDCGRREHCPDPIV